MSKKEKSAAFVKRYEHVLQCPICKTPMKVVEQKSLICMNHHTFDFAKQGYVNMLTRAASSHYDKTLFEARHRTIVESGLYHFLHQQLAKIIKEATREHASKIVLDAGCGEGSHLNKVIEECSDESVIGVGLDIAKEGIKMAASHYQNAIWMVGDLANTPLADRSCSVILNILSPANYAEFKRLLAPGGIVIKVIPRSDYLKELRESLYADTEKEAYQNNDTLELFQEQFYVKSRLPIRYTKKLSQNELEHFIRMSPLSWNGHPDRINRFLNQEKATITIDLEIVVGIMEGE